MCFHSYDRQLRSKQEENQKQVAALVDRVRQMEALGALPDMRKQLDLVKDSLRELVVNEALYLEYKGVPEDRQSIKVRQVAALIGVLGTALNWWPSAHRSLCARACTS